MPTVVKERVESTWRTSLIVFTAWCAVAPRVAAQNFVGMGRSLGSTLGTPIVESTQDERENRCVGNAITGGVIVAGGSFLLYKILSAGPTGGNPGKDGAIFVVSLATGAAYTVWRVNRCRQNFSAVRLNAAPNTRLSPFGRNRVGFNTNPRRGNRGAYEFPSIWRADMETVDGYLGWPGRRPLPVHGPNHSR